MGLGDRATNAEADFKSPISENLMTKKYRDFLDLMEELIRNTNSFILGGALDADPTNAAPSTFVDADPTVGTIDRDDKFNGLRLKFTSGTANGQRFTITDTDAATDKLTFAENLFAAGARLGDTYIILGHTHSGGTDGIKIEDDDIVSAQTFEWEAGVGAGIESGSGGPDAIAFSTAFPSSGPVPIVVAYVGDQTSGSASTREATVGIQNVTHAGFDVKIEASVSPATFFDVHYFACLPGQWITNGILIVAGYLPSRDEASLDMVHRFFRTFDRTPLIFSTVIATDPHALATTDLGRVNPVITDMYPSQQDFMSLATGIDDAGHGFRALGNRGSADGAGILAFIAIAPTSTTSIGLSSYAMNVTSAFGGTGSIFEAGINAKHTTELLPVTFNTVFGSAPVCLHALATSSAAVADFAVDDVTTSGFTAQSALGGATVHSMLMAIEREHGTDTDAKRLI